jgi:hypothetical protein
MFVGSCGDASLKKFRMTKDVTGARFIKECPESLLQHVTCGDSVGVDWGLRNDHPGVFFLHLMLDTIDNKSLHQRYEILVMVCDYLGRLV